MCGRSAYTLDCDGPKRWQETVRSQLQAGPAGYSAKGTLGTGSSIFVAISASR